MFEFANALRVADIADLPPWSIEDLVKVMDINSDGRINLPELDISLMKIRMPWELNLFHTKKNLQILKMK